MWACVHLVCLCFDVACVCVSCVRDQALKVSDWDLKKAIEQLHAEGVFDLMLPEYNPPQPQPKRPETKAPQKPAQEGSRPQLNKLLSYYVKNGARIYTRVEYMQLKCLEALGRIDYLSFAQFNSHLEKSKRHAKSQVLRITRRQTASNRRTRRNKLVRQKKDAE
jgi:hypothetical protein